MSKILHLSEQDVIELLKLWLFLGVAIQSLNRQGTSNTTYIVNTSTGKFILKIYGSTLTTQIQYEHLLLTYLQHLDLSFAVPAPIPVPSGETLVLVKIKDTLLRVALFSLISGQPAERKNLAHTYAAGKSLGELHRALAGFAPQGQLAQLPCWGDLYHIHSLITDPFEVPKLLGLNLDQHVRFVKTLTEVLEVQPWLYTTLPLQTIHADYLCMNILLENNKVAGVLDFEFATNDLRLMDYIAALDHFALFPWHKEFYWEFVQAFSTGYNEQLTLVESERDAMTITWRLQRLSSIVYWTGWLLEGKATHQSIVDGVTEMLLFEDWLKNNATTLLKYV